MADRPTLLDFVVFFETEPEWVNSEGWYYGARFTTRRGDDRIVATIAPDDAGFSFEWWQSDVLRAKLQTVMAINWEIVSAGSQELLRVTYNDEHVKFCELQLKPHIRVEWAMTW